MIQAIIIDDEADGREALEMAVKRYCPDIDLKGIFSSPEMGVEAIRNIKPQLVFLDVQMPGMSGFDVLKQVGPVSFKVIFVSAYDRYAIKAIRFSAMDYLLKPIDVEELVSAVNRVKALLPEKSTDYTVQSVLNNVQHKAGFIERLAVPSLDGIDFFETKDLIFCKAEGSYTTLYLLNKQSKLVTRNLKDFENILADSGFYRVHHSYLINLRHVQRYVRGEGGHVVMTNQHEVDVSRRRKEEFLALLDNHEDNNERRIGRV
jgi:two-component system, LytTR family, response regulator